MSQTTCAKFQIRNVDRQRQEKSKEQKRDVIPSQAESPVRNLLFFACGTNPSSSANEGCPRAFSAGVTF
jgi:hypothetical protein